MSDLEPVNASLDPQVEADFVPVHYIVVTRDEGRVVQSGSCPISLFALLENDDRVAVVNTLFDSVPPEAVYSPDGSTVAARPLMKVSIDKTQIVADDTDEATISGLPAGAVLFVNGGEYPVTGDKVVLTLDRPATVEIVAKCWPYVDATFVLDAD